MYILISLKLLILGTNEEWDRNLKRNSLTSHEKQHSMIKFIKK